MQDAILLCSVSSPQLGRCARRCCGFWNMGWSCRHARRAARSRWKRPIYGTMYRMLTNPVYGGAYAYGKTERTHQVTKAENERKRHRRKPRDQWLALDPRAHEGYVEWDEFERIQRAIHGNLRLAGTLAPP